MKRLILSTIPDDYDPNNDIPIGPGCFLDRENVYPEWESLPFEFEPFTTPEKLTEASRMTCIYANSIIPCLSSELNQKNRVRYSDEFWKIMLLPWLLTLVQTTWERQSRIQKLINKYKEKKLSVELVDNDIQWDFYDTLDYIHRGVLNPIYNWWLYSRLVEADLPENWRINYKKVNIDFKNISPKTKSWKLLLRERFFSNLRCYGVYGIGYLGSLIWSLYLSVKHCAVNPQKHSFKNNFDHIDIPWLLDISNLVQKFIPICFQDLQVIEKKKITPKPNKIRLIGPSVYYDESMKYKFALCRVSGEKLVHTQHGGLYGNAQVFPFAAELEYNHDMFISWGWTGQENYQGNIQPLPSPYLSAYKDKHTQKNNSLILVSTRATLYSHRLDPTGQSAEMIVYRKNKVSFLKPLRINVLKDALYRPYFNESGALKDISYIQNIFPELKICEGNLYPQILKCKLLILDHPITTLNVAMVANIPMVGFWNKQHWAMCKQATPYFDSLENAGVFFQTGEEAAQKVNEIWDDVQDWWNQNQIQKARREWCHQYARTDRFWWWEWAKMLWKM